MRVKRCLSIILLAITSLHAAESKASGIVPPPSLPEPSWVHLIDQRATDERLAGYLCPRGIKLEIVAENPALSRAGSLCFGTDGSLMLLEWPPEAEANAKKEIEIVIYRDGTRRSLERMNMGARTQVKIVHDINGKGAFEQAKLVLEEPGISCILPHGNWLYAAGDGSVRRYRRTRNDGPFDVREVVARGFDGLGSRPPFGLAFDFDGSLIISAGIGNHDVEGSDGSRARAAGSGAIFRCRPEGSRMELLAIGTCHPLGGPAFDNEFHLFQLDGADAQENSKRRLLHVAEGSDFGFRSSFGSRLDSDDLARRLCLRDLPGVMAPVYSAARGVSGGACIYNDSRFPSFIQGLVLFPEPARRTIRALKPERRDSTFKITEGFDLVRCNDPLFEPAHVLIGPDGAIYFSDRPARAANEGRPQTPKRETRLYRLSWVGGPSYPALALRSLTSWSRFVSLGGTDLVMSLGSADFTDRRVAQQELIRRGTINKTGLIEAVGNPKLTVDARMLAAGVLSSIWDNDIKNVLIKLATDDEAVLRRMAAECLGRNSPKQDPQIQEALLYILGDPDSDSRRSVALAMAKVAAPDGADSLATALSFDIGSDLYLRDGLVRALERLGKPGLEPLLAMANSGEEDRLDLAVESWCALRSPLALELLPQLLANPHLRTEQRVRLVRSLARYQIVHSKDLLAVVRSLAEKGPNEPDVWMALIEVGNALYARRLGGLVKLVGSLARLSP